MPGGTDTKGYEQAIMALPDLIRIRIAELSLRLVQQYSKERLSKLRKILYNFDLALHVRMGLAMICILAKFGERECKGLAGTNQTA